MRVDAWDGADELEEMNLKILHDRLDEAFQLLRSNGCEFIGLLGKSFGGQLGLTWPDHKLDFKVLWAPAIGFREEDVEKWKSTWLKHAQTATEISVDKAFLEKIEFEVKIFHGAEDEVVDTENSRKICEALENCEFSEIEGSSHSFKQFEEELYQISTCSMQDLS